MVLYTCGQKKRGPASRHACARAGKALDAAGHEYELRTVRGYRLPLFPMRESYRAEIRELSSQDGVPILVLDDGEAIVGSQTIARWAEEHAPAPVAS